MRIPVIQNLLDLEQSELLYSFDTFRPEEWNIIRHSPEWTVGPDSIIGGRADEIHHGQIFFHRPVTGEIVLEFDAGLIPPSEHDLVWWWQTSLDRDPWGEGYLGCLGGWWNNLAGIEKSPSFMPCAIAPSCPVEPGRSYHIVSGSVNGIAFIAVDGKLVSFLADPNPPAPDRPGYFGFGVYQSHAWYRNLKVYRPHVTRLPCSYLKNGQ